MTNAQRSAEQVRIILEDHDNDREIAFVKCIECKDGFSVYDSKFVSDEEVANRAEDAGWSFHGFGQWTCPRHSDN